MAQLKVRNVDKKLVRRIKKAAEAHRRSLSVEVREALGRVFTPAGDRAKALARMDALRRRSRPGPSAATLVRQVRDGV